MTILMLAPEPNMTFAGAPSGATYVADAHGIIVAVGGADQTALQSAGCLTLAPFGGTFTNTQALLLGTALQNAGVLPVLSFATLTAYETIAPGAFVNCTQQANKVRNGSAADPTLYADGFCVAGAAIGEVATVLAMGLCPVTLTGNAAEVWLSDTVPGSWQTSPPTTTGHISQSLGLAVPGQGIFFAPQTRFTL